LKTVVAKAGNDIPLAAKFRLGVTADYSFALGDSMKASIDGRYRESSSFYSEAGNDPALKNDGAKQLYLGFAVAGAKWGSISLYGDNLLNRSDTTLRQRQVGVGLIYSVYVRPRTLGIEYKLDF
jgi:hypothetical protein